MKKSSLYCKLSIFIIIMISCSVFLSGCGSENPVENSSSEEIVQSSIAELSDTIYDFVDKYNEVSPSDLTYAETFDVKDKENGHYRTEYRLSVFNNAVAKSYNFDDSVIDIVVYKHSKTNVIVYSSNISMDKAVELIKYMSPILDENLSEEDINSAIDNLLEKGESNGYFFGDLRIDLMGYEKNEYEFLLERRI